MEKKDVALGLATCVESGVGECKEPASLEERVAVLEEKLDLILKMLTVNGIHERVEVTIDDLGEVEPAEVNEDGIPIGINLVGFSKGNAVVLVVKEDAYYIGHKPYKSLSAAATEIRGSRVSGWVFWKLPDGRTVKEVFQENKHG